MRYAKRFFWGFAVILLIAWGVWVILPALITFQTSFLPTYAVMNPTRFIQRASLRNWTTIPGSLLLKWFRNSVIVCGLTTIIATFIATLGGYGFAKYEFPGKRPLFWLFLLAMTIPPMMLFLPRFFTVKTLGLVDSYPGLILPFIIYPAGVFFARQYILGIPDEFAEAARLDGASEFQVFRLIIMPLCLPLLAILSLLVFMPVWGNFMWQFLIARDPELHTVVVGVGNLLRGYAAGGEFTVGWAAKQGAYLEGLEAVVSTLLAVPPLMVFILGQRYFVKGLTLGAPE